MINQDGQSDSRGEVVAIETEKRSLKPESKDAITHHARKAVLESFFISRVMTRRVLSTSTRVQRHQRSC